MLNIPVTIGRIIGRTVGRRVSIKSFLKKRFHESGRAPNPIVLPKATVNIEKVSRFLKKYQRESEKALNLAVKREAFFLTKTMKREIRAGAPGGQRFAPLSSLSRFTSSRRGSKKTAMARLHYGVRYQFREATPGRPFQAKVGFIGGPKPVHKFFQDIAKEHTHSFTKLITPKQRQFFIKRGASLLGRGNVGADDIRGEMPFFLKKSTRHFRTPARPIIEPFWKAHKEKAKQNIKRNYALKMKGQRI